MNPETNPATNLLTTPGPRLAYTRPDAPTPAEASRPAAMLALVAEHDDATPDERYDPLVSGCGWGLVTAWARLRTPPECSARTTEALEREARALRSTMTEAELAADTAEKWAYLHAHQAEWDACDRGLREGVALPLGLTADNTWDEVWAASDAEAKRREALPLRQALAWVDPSLLDAMGIDLTPDLRVVRERDAMTTNKTASSEGSMNGADEARLLRTWCYLKAKHDPGDMHMPYWLNDAHARRSVMSDTELAADNETKKRYVDQWPAESARYNADWDHGVAEQKADMERRAKLPPRLAVAAVAPELLDALGIDLTPKLRVAPNGDAATAASTVEEGRLLCTWCYMKAQHDPNGMDVLEWTDDANARRSTMSDMELAADNEAKQRYVDQWPAERDWYTAEMDRDIAAQEADAARRAKLPPRLAMADVAPELLDALGTDLTPKLRVVK